MEKFRYSGQVNSNEIPDGYGSGNVYILGLFWAGGYTGFWRNGYPDGNGKLEASTKGPLKGSYYKGAWKEGGMSGDGVFKYPDGSKFEGTFNVNGPVYGKLTYANKDTFTGK